MECPSCGKDIGMKSACMYCGASRKRRLAVTMLLLYSLPLLITGILLFTLGEYSETPIENIDNLDASMNFKHVRVRGIVVDSDYIEVPYSEYGKLTIYVGNNMSSKGKSVVKVRCEPVIVEELTKEKRVPMIGDLVDIEGTLYAGEGYRLINVNSAEFVKIVKMAAEYKKHTVIELLSDPRAFENDLVMLEDVVVVDVYKTWKFEVADTEDSHYRLVVYGADIHDIKKGDIVIVRGHFEYYKPKWGEGYWEIEIKKGTRDEVIIKE